MSLYMGCILYASSAWIFRFLMRKFAYFHTKSTIHWQQCKMMKRSVSITTLLVWVYTLHWKANRRCVQIKLVCPPLEPLRHHTETIQLHHIIQGKNSKRIWPRSHDGFSFNISTHSHAHVWVDTLLSHKWIKIQKFKLVEQNVWREFCGAQAREKVLLTCVLFLARAIQLGN